jgi:hypothetical protein
MFAFIFVYSPTKFSVDGPEPIKRFDLGSTERRTYLQAESVIEAENTDVLEKGIYGTGAEGDNPRFRALDSTETVDYDIVISKDKDPLPSIISVQPDGTNRTLVDRSQRIRETFPGVTDDDLGQFLVSRKAPT